MKLHIGNLPKTITEQQLRDLVKPFGDATKFEIAKDVSGAPKGFAFAEFANDDQAKAAITGLNGKDVNGQVLRVSEARPRRADQPKSSAPQA
jgi:cold-inducible RNA-binding protein